MDEGARVVVVGGSAAARAQLEAALAARGIAVTEQAAPGGAPDLLLALDAAACAAEPGLETPPFVLAFAAASASAAELDALHAAGADEVAILPVHFAAAAGLVEQRLRGVRERAAARIARRCAEELETIARLAAESGDRDALPGALLAFAAALGADRALAIANHDPPWLVEVLGQSGGFEPRVVDLAAYPEARAAIAGAELVLLGAATAPGVPRGAHPELAARAAELSRQGFASAVAVPLRAAGLALGALVFHHRGRCDLTEHQVAFANGAGGLIARAWAASASAGDAVVVADDGEDTNRHRSTQPHPTDRLETELRKTMEFLEKLIESTVDAIVAADADGTVILFNPGAVRLFGRRAEEVLSQLHVDTLYPEGVSRQIMRMLRSPSYGGVGRLELTRREVLSSTGELIPVSMTASIIYDGVREVATVGVLSDLRDRIRIEQRLLQAQEKLMVSEKQALVAELAGAAAHELNQPLTSVLLAAEMLARHVSAEDPLGRAARAIEGEVLRMAEIVKKIGKITHYESITYVGAAHILDLDKASRDDK